MIEAIVDWMRDELAVEAFAHEIPLSQKITGDLISVTRVPGGPEPRGSYRRDELSAWCYSTDLRSAEALYQRLAAALKGFRRVVTDDGGMVISLKEAGSASYNLDERRRDPNVFVPLTAIISRR